VTTRQLRFVLALGAPLALVLAAGPAAVGWRDARA
jgi:hypothetical protein